MLPAHQTPPAHMAEATRSKAVVHCRTLQLSPPEVGHAHTEEVFPKCTYIVCSGQKTFKSSVIMSHI